MLLSILHKTQYQYTASVQYTIQTLRLTPRAEPHQRVLRWSVQARGDLVAASDAYGNLAHTLTLTEPHRDLEINAHGEIETEALRDGLLPDLGGVPPLSFVRPTARTVVDERVLAFAGQHLRRTDAAGLLDFASAVRAAITYEPGSSDVEDTAAKALAQGRGVCQDHAHVFIAGCRARGVPARYVSGYVHPGDAPHAASHAWADAFVPDRGWISIDVTHGRYADDSLCRLAVGRDYDSACPVRGVRVGGGEETMQARVNIRPFTLHGGPLKEDAAREHRNQPPSRA